MRLAPDATPDMEEHSKHEKQPVIRCIDKEEELCVGEDGLIAVVPVDIKSRMKKLKRLLECREDELRQAAEYGLGLLEANGELQMQVATLKIQLETETEELSVDRNTWQRRTEQAQQETAQWKRKFARAEEEKTELVEEFECFVRRCECSRHDAEKLANDCASSSGQKCSDHLDTIARLQRELQDVQAAQRVKESELTMLRLWKEGAVQQQQEALACEVVAAQKEVTDIAEVEEELAATQRAMRVLTNEKDALRELVEKHEEDMRALNKHLRNAEAGKDDAEILSNELTEKLLSLESRCTRLQRELELLQHVSYFTQAVVDCDDEESDEDDGIDEEKNSQTAVLDTNEIENTDTTQAAENSENGAVPLTVRTKRQRSGLVEPGTPRTLCPTTEEGSHAQAPESEHEMNAKLHHYFHLTALSIIHENSLHERCFDSSSRLTIDMWHREVIAKEVPFLLWHSWLINRIGEVAMLVQDEGGVPQGPTRAPNVRGAFFKFSLLKLSGSGGTTPRNNPAASPSSVASSPASSPVARVPFAVARAFFRLVRKRTRAGAEPSPVGGSPACGAPVG